MKAANFLKRAVTGLGGILALAMLLQLAAPRAVHAVVSALVTVANTSANPVPTQAADNPARQAIVLNTFVDLPSGILDGESKFDGPPGGSYTVPAGQRLVIETISGAINEPAGQRPALLTVSTKVSQFIASVFPASGQLSLLSSDGLIDFYTYATPLKMYADPGTNVFLNCSRGNGSSFTGDAHCTASVIGHLENAE
jgi:hypothetical protein